MTVELSDAAKDKLIEIGFDPTLGARPLRRAMQREVEDRLSEKILHRRAWNGRDHVKVDVENGRSCSRPSPRGEKVAIGVGGGGEIAVTPGPRDHERLIPPGPAGQPRERMPPEGRHPLSRVVRSYAGRIDPSTGSGRHGFRRRARLSATCSSPTCSGGSCSARIWSCSTKRCSSSSWPKPRRNTHRLRRPARDVGGPGRGAHPDRGRRVAASRCGARDRRSARGQRPHARLLTRMFCLTFGGRLSRAAASRDRRAGRGPRRVLAARAQPRRRASRSSSISPRTSPNTSRQHPMLKTL